MNLKQQLAEDLKQAMRAGDETRKSTIRLLRAAIVRAEQDKRGAVVEAEKARRGTLENVDLGLTDEQFELTDDEIIAVLIKQARQRRDSIDAFRKGGREDLAAIEEAELAVIQGYLPPQLSREEIAREAQAVITELGATGLPQQGLIMRHLMARLQGRAEGRVVSEVVRELLKA